LPTREEVVSTVYKRVLDKIIYVNKRVMKVRKRRYIIVVELKGELIKGREKRIKVANKIEPKNTGISAFG
jgi:hypothetical protein